MSTLATLLEQSNKLSASQYVPNSNSNNFGASTSSNQASTSAGPSHAPTNSLPTLQLGFQELSNQSRRILTRANASNTRDDGTSAGGNA